MKGYVSIILKCKSNGFIVAFIVYKMIYVVLIVALKTENKDSNAELEQNSNHS